MRLLKEWCVVFFGWEDDDFELVVFFIVYLVNGGYIWSDIDGLVVVFL